MLFFGSEQIKPGVTLNTYFCEETNRIYHEYVQDVAPVIDLNQYMQSEFTTFNAIGDGFTYANIPDILIEKWRNEDGFDFYKEPVEEAVKRLRNDEYQYLRATKGKM